MGVYEGDAGLFLHEVAHGGEQGDVFEHIGMVARVESVSITEHASMVTNNPKSGSYPVVGKPDVGFGGPMMGAMRSLM
jgi:hypothetical protein